MSKTGKTKATAGTGLTGGEYDVAALAGARRIEYMRLDQVPAAERNPKSHDLAAIVLSIARFGFTDPALLDERTGRLVGGHGRLEAVRAIKAYADGGAAGARSAGYSLPATMWAQFDESVAERGTLVPGGVASDPDGWSVPIVRGWASADDAEASALLIALNRMTELGGWDKGMLADLLVDLEEVDLLEVAGYDSSDLDTLLAKTGKLVELDPEPMPEITPAPAPAPAAEQPAAPSAPVNPVRNPVDDGTPGEDEQPAAPVPPPVASPFAPPAPAELRPEQVEHYRQQYGVMVVCATEEEQNRVLAQLEHEGYRVRAITT